jgi:archaellum component FlaC
MELSKEHFDQQIEQLHSQLLSDFKDEIAPLKTQLTSIENKVDRISVRTTEDHIATMRDVERLEKRLKAVEKELKLSHA